MSTIIPIFIPQNNEPSKCPGCKQPEDYVRKCKNCGHEYEVNNDITVKDILFAIGILIVFIFLLFTGLDWLFGNDTLVEVLVHHLKWVLSLFDRLW